ncbi:MAG: iron-only hydrogenase system regulator [Clostridium sp.]|nr:iron-only hydrogenase system regulator [Clostridium sp.]
MNTRIALIGVIVEDVKSVEKLNTILHTYGEYIIGRMGIPYKSKSVSIISIVVDAPSDVISALSGKLGMLPGVNTKTIYSKVPLNNENK